MSVTSPGRSPSPIRNKERQNVFAFQTRRGETGSPSFPEKTGDPASPLLDSISTCAIFENLSAFLSGISAIKSLGFPKI